MNNYTTAKTAWKLKEKGFPQPPTDRGQIWFDTDGTPFESNEFSKLDLRHFAFAPTPCDILREVDRYILSYYAGNFQCETFGKIYIHENPAEACALAYLDK